MFCFCLQKKVTYPPPRCFVKKKFSLIKLEAGNRVPQGSLFFQSSNPPGTKEVKITISDISLQ